MVKQETKEDKDSGLICQNRKARFDYHILDSFEAGIVLTGSEIKSIRAGQVKIEEGYVSAKGGELQLLGVHIQEYKQSDNRDYNPLRPRKLLMHRSEIDKLRGQIEQKGLTIVPLRLYLKRGKAKLEIGLAKGKDAPDKRKTIKAREQTREMARFTRRG